MAPPATGVGPSPAGPATKAWDPIPMPYPADLPVVSLGLSSANPKVGERVFATATLRNRGSQALAGVRVSFFLGKIQVGEKLVTVAAGGSATASLSFKAAPGGAQNLMVQVDPGAGLAPLALARGLTVLAATKTDVEDFTTPTPKTTATKDQ